MLEQAPRCGHQNIRCVFKGFPVGAVVNTAGDDAAFERRKAAQQLRLLMYL